METCDTGYERKDKAMLTRIQSNLLRESFLLNKTIEQLLEHHAWASNSIIGPTMKVVARSSGGTNSWS